MTQRMGPQTAGRATPQPSVHSLPAELVEVALVDAKTCASTGGMRLSWWHGEVAAGRAPQPVIRRPRCTRWRLSDVRAFWAALAENSRENTEATDRLLVAAKKASQAARAKRAVQGYQVVA